MKTLFDHGQDSENGAAQLAAAVVKHPALAGHEYTRPDSYVGATFYGCFAILGVHRDSDSVARSNWETAKRIMAEASEGIPLPADVYGDTDPLDDAAGGGAWWNDTEASHWAVGWVQTLYVRADAPDAILAAAAKMLTDLEGYPVLDESHLSEVESEDEFQCWDSYGRGDFVREFEEELKDELADNGTMADLLYRLAADSRDGRQSEYNGESAEFFTEGNAAAVTDSMIEEARSEAKRIDAEHEAARLERLANLPADGE